MRWYLDNLMDDGSYDNGNSFVVCLCVGHGYID
jgi:hypothetical protein